MNKLGSFVFLFILAQPSLKAGEVRQPKRPYGFNYTVQAHSVAGQELTEIDLYDPTTAELIDQLSVVQYRDGATNLPLKVKSYEEAEKLCESLPLDLVMRPGRYQTGSFYLPYDHQIFFLIDEDLLGVERSIKAETFEKIVKEVVYPFWTQGAYDPGSVSPFKLDSDAGYIIDKMYSTGFLFGFLPSERLSLYRNQLEDEIQALETRQSAIQNRLSVETFEEEYLKLAHANQISKLGRIILEKKRELTIVNIQQEGLEVHCVAGGQLDASHFKGHLMSRKVLDIR